MRLALVALLLVGCGGSAAECDYCPGAVSTRQTVADTEVVTCACPSRADRFMGFTVPDTPRDCGVNQLKWRSYVAAGCQ